MLLQRTPRNVIFSLNKSVFSVFSQGLFSRLLSTMGVPQAELEAKLREKLDCTHVELTDLSDGCGQKFAAIIVSPQFVGKNLITQQRLVNAAIADELKEIHAFTQRTYTPEAWEKTNK